MLSVKEQSTCLPFPVVDLSSLQAGALRSLDGLQACILSCPRQSWSLSLLLKPGEGFLPIPQRRTGCLSSCHHADMVPMLEPLEGRAHHSVPDSQLLPGPSQTVIQRAVGALEMHPVTLSPVTGRRPGA